MRNATVPKTPDPFGDWPGGLAPSQLYVVHIMLPAAVSPINFWGLDLQCCTLQRWCCVTPSPTSHRGNPTGGSKKQEFTGALAAVSVGCSHRLSRGGLFMPLPRLRRWLGWLEETRPCDPDCQIARCVVGEYGAEMWEKGGPDAELRCQRLGWFHVPAGPRPCGGLAVPAGARELRLAVLS